jgi:hypothetical protein
LAFFETTETLYAQPDMRSAHALDGIVLFGFIDDNHYSVQKPVEALDFKSKA